MLTRTTIGPPPALSCGSSVGDPSNGPRGIPLPPVIPARRRLCQDKLLRALLPKRFLFTCKNLFLPASLLRSGRPAQREISLRFERAGGFAALAAAGRSRCKGHCYTSVSGLPYTLKCVN